MSAYYRELFPAFSLEDVCLVRELLCLLYVVDCPGDFFGKANTTTAPKDTTAPKIVLNGNGTLGFLTSGQATMTDQVRDCPGVGFGCTL
jgi:hypothetical protein